MKKEESFIEPDKLITIPDDKEMNVALLSELLGKHRQLVTNRYLKLKHAYIGDYPILEHPEKESWKPDNRVIVNFAKYIVDTMNGFFIGKPIKTSSDDERVNDYIQMVNKYNDQEDNDAELSRICSIYGKGYEIYFNDESSQIGIMYLNPMEGFMVYDESIMQKPRYFISYMIDSEKIMHGEIRDESLIIPFNDKGGLHLEEPVTHGFDDIPASEFIENEERMAIFEPCYSMINAYNKAISEKANDVDYFADAYLKIIGPRVDQDDVKQIRENRIVTVELSEGQNAEVEFMSKPSADTTQENLINRLERLIYQNSMVPNINDENFGTSSGIAIRYKLLSMSNLAKIKERKFVSGLNRRYKLIFSNPINSMSASDWMNIKYTFYQNVPSNISDEAETAQKLDGIVSDETRLSVLSIVDNPKDEIERKEKEQEKMQSNSIIDSLFSNRDVVNGELNDKEK